VATPRGLCKGTLFVHTRQFVLATGGRAAWDHIEARLPARDRKLLDGLMLVGRWYPIGAWNRLIDSYVTEFHPTRMMELARYTATEDLSAMFKRVLKLGSPEMILRRSNALYTRYFKCGVMDAQELAPRRWSLILDAPMGAETGPGAITCTHGICGWIMEGLSLTGVRGAQILHARCRFGGARYCEYEAAW
jgi:hypothetical protein